MESFRRELAKMKTWFRANPGAEGQHAVGAQQPFYLAYIPRNHRATLADYGALCNSLMSAWARRIGVPKPAPAGGAKCRVGIVSAHLHSHSVWHAIVRGWVEHLDPAKFELHLFHTGGARDAETEWAARRTARLSQGLGDWTTWAKTISDTRLDVLIYPEIGMDSTTTRLAALRLAPVQLASWGHPITTGLPTIDGYLSAEALEPDGAAAHYSEKLIRLPRLGCCYRPFGSQATLPDLVALGISPADKVLLCAGTSFKYAPKDDALLVEIARRCAPCKLVFFRAEPVSLSELLEARLRKAFEAAGVAVDDAVRFIPWQSQSAFFGLLDRADVFLDGVQYRLQHGDAGDRTRHADRGLGRRVHARPLRERDPARGGPGRVGRRHERRLRRTRRAAVFRAGLARPREAPDRAGAGDAVRRPRRRRRAGRAARGVVGGRRGRLISGAHAPAVSERHDPDFPPCFSSTRMSPITIPRSIALTMS